MRCNIYTRIIQILFSKTFLYFFTANIALKINFKYIQVKSITFRVSRVGESFLFTSLICYAGKFLEYTKN